MSIKIQWRDHTHRAMNIYRKCYVTIKKQTIHMKKLNGLFVSVFLITLLISCKKDYVGYQESTSTSTRRVRVQELKPIQSPMVINASGVLASSSEMNLSFKIQGIVSEVLADEGQRVRKGATLARLNLSEINAQVLQAKRNFEKATRDFDRIQNLYQDSVATLEQLQDTQTLLDVAKADLDIANFNLQYAHITAPMNGKVLKRMVEPNELINPGQPMFVLGTAGTQGAQVIKIGLADVDVVKISAKDSAFVTFDPFPDRRYPAYISEITEAANPATGTFEVELTLSPVYYPEVKNGFVGKVKVFPSNTTPYYQVPMTALIEGVEKEALVYLTDDKKTAYQKRLSVATIHADFFIVPAKDMKASLWVVTEGGAYLSNNDSIELLN